ncbi:MAG: hypothetical protein K6A65_07075 [Succinivibrionaceae bacterium]|nr:hypothetical protein [Succinivibrionaceae bacterium]
MNAKHIRKGARLLLLAVALGATCGCSGMLSGISYRLSSDNGVSKPPEFPVLRATGYAVLSRQPGPSAAERQIQAMRASKMEAYRELTEQVYGTYIRADTAMGDTVQRRNNSSASVEGMLHGARVIRQYPLGDTYVTEVELDSRVVYDMYQIRGAI